MAECKSPRSLLSDITFGTISLGSGTGFLDTGTSLIYLPHPVFTALMNATGGQTDPTTEYTTFPTAPTAIFSIVIGGTSFDLTPAQYLIPASQLANYGLQSNGDITYSWLADGGEFGSDTFFVIGQKFLENYYSIYDTTYVLNIAMCF